MSLCKTIWNIFLSVCLSPKESQVGISFFLSFSLCMVFPRPNFGHWRGMFLCYVPPAFQLPPTRCFVIFYFCTSVRLYVWRLLSINKNFSSVGSISAKLLGIGSQVWKIKSSFEYYHSTTYLSTYLPFYISSNSSQRKTFRGSELHFVKFESNRFLHLSTSEFGQEMKSMTQSIDVGSSPCR